jgi:hypothetical protein
MGMAQKSAPKKSVDLRDTKKNHWTSEPHRNFLLCTSDCWKMLEIAVLHEILIQNPFSQQQLRVLA